MAKLTWNSRNVREFYRFIYERQSVWHRRFVEKTSEPWTDNLILQKNKFTNIYRELDPGTVFCRTQIMERDEPRPDIVFNVMMYRLMCKISTYQFIGFQHLNSFSTKRLENDLRMIYETGEPVFGNAYLISPYSSMGSDLKYVNVARLFGSICFSFDDFFQKLDRAPSFEMAFKVINSMYGFGPFLAYQVMVDLTYPLDTKYRSAILPFSQDDWARLGPGALRGLARMIHTWSTPQTLSALRWLHANQQKMFERYELDFPYLKNEEGREIPISLANMQNCLCEYSKYANIKEGSGKAQRLFVPSTGRSW